MRDWKLALRAPLRGQLRVPGDKSISHRALMLGALADGVTVITGLSDGEDVRSTRACLQALGVVTEDGGELTHGPSGETWSEVRVHGRSGALTVCKKTLPCGNSGTTIRLLMGVLAGQPFKSKLSGDASLRRRPMKRVAQPLLEMGAKVALTKEEFAPVTVQGGGLKPIAYKLPMASAQVKSAVLLAGLFAAGETSVEEPSASRDHTERMLSAFGVPVGQDGTRRWINGPARLKASPIQVPGDISSAAFWLAAACLVPESELRVAGVGVNPTRTGFLEVLRRMGGAVHAEPVFEGDEPISDLTARASALVAAETTPDEFPKLIDEAPLLAVIASQARGTTRIRGAGELRHKETDRIAGIARMLEAFGAKCSVEGDDILIPGPQKLKAGVVDPKGDHRIAMAGAVAALAADGDCEVQDAGCADISYPGFFDAMDRLLHG